MNVFEGYYPTTNTLTHSSSIKFRNQSLIQYGKPWYYHLCDASELHLQDLFRDTPLDHIWHTQLCGQIRPNTPNTVIGARIWARIIWSIGVSLKRSWKMKFRRIDLVSIGPPSQKLWPNLIFGWFPHCNYNVKIKSACGFLFIGL